MKEIYMDKSARPWVAAQTTLMVKPPLGAQNRGPRGPRDLYLISFLCLYLISFLCLYLKYTGKGESWKMDIMLEKMPFSFTFDITRVNCWKGAFKGMGTMVTKVPQTVTIEGTLFDSGDAVFVFTHINKGR